MKRFLSVAGVALFAAVGTAGAQNLATSKCPPGTTNAALGKRAWNLNATEIIDPGVTPPPCRNCGLGGFMAARPPE